MDRDESQKSTMLERDSECHEAFADGNRNEVVLLHKFGLYGKVNPVNMFLACLLSFPKDRMVESDFFDVSFFGKFSFSQISHIDVQTGQLMKNKCRSTYIRSML